MKSLKFPYLRTALAVVVGIGSLERDGISSTHTGLPNRSFPRKREPICGPGQLSGSPLPRGRAINSANFLLALALAVLVIPATAALATDVIRTAEGPVTTSAAKADAELGLKSVIGVRQPPVVLPHRAAKSDSLLHRPAEPEPAAADLRRNLEPLRGGVHATADEPVPAPEEPNFAPDFALGADADDDAEADAEAVTATRSVPVTTDVNMRARPDNSAPVILVVPGRRHVEVIGCDFWCEVVYNGKRGWIYKSFVPGAQS
jgi:hypothetical protein